MQRADLAARRIYRALHNLTILRSARLNHYRVSNPRRPNAVRCFTSNQRRRAASSPDVVADLYESIATPTKSEIEATAAQEGLQWVLRDPIENVVERPFSKLKRWDHAVRERTPTHTLVEIAVPKPALPQLARQTYTKAWVTYRKFVAKVRVTDIKHKMKKHDYIICVQVSGPVADVLEAVKWISPLGVQDRMLVQEKMATARKSRDDPEHDAKVGVDVRGVLRALTHPVVVITSQESRFRLPSRKNHISPTWRGVTVSSFGSVTMRPRPMVSFNLKIPSRTFDAIKLSGAFRVHILASTPRGAAIASAFTQRYENAHDPFRRLKAMGLQIEVPEKASSPIITCSEGGILASMDVGLLKKSHVNVGDHVVIFGEIREFPVSTKQVPEIEKPAGLAYGEGSYLLRGQSIEAETLPEVTTQESDELQKLIAVEEDEYRRAMIEEDNEFLEDEHVDTVPEEAETDDNANASSLAGSNLSTPVHTVNSSRAMNARS